jgi:hypothetical protein
MRKLLLALALTAGCYFGDGEGPRYVPDDYVTSCVGTVAPAPVCEPYYVWVLPAEVNGVWYPGHYALRPGWNHRYPVAPWRPWYPGYRPGFPRRR